MQVSPHDHVTGQEFAVSGFTAGRFLYRPEDERDACGVGFVAHVRGTASHEIAITIAFAVAIAIGSFVYVAIFLALGVATSRGLVIGLGYALLWEGLLAGALPGTQLLSVREYVRGIISTLAPPGTLTSVVGAQGFVAALVAVVVITALASYRLAVYEVRASE